MNRTGLQTSGDAVMDYQTRRLQDLIQELIQCCRERTSYLSAKYGIPEAELRCLMLFGNERYLTPKGIAKKLEVAKSRVSKIVGGLQKRGLVEVTADPKDARVKLISLTARGQRQANDIEEFTAKLHQEILEELEPEQRKMVLSCLEALRTSMQTVKKQLE